MKLKGNFHKKTEWIAMLYISWC